MLNVMLLAEPPLETLTLALSPVLLHVHVADWVQEMVTLALKRPKSFRFTGDPADVPPFGVNATFDLP